MATIQEVAHLAGVSTGTVSRYLNGHRLKESNRKRVQEAIDALDYHRNVLAQGLRSNRTMTIGMLMNNETSLVSSSMVSEIENTLEARDYTVIISGFRSNGELFEKKLDTLLSRQVDGLIVFEANCAWDSVAALGGVDVPVVAINALLAVPGVDSVLADDRESCRQVVERMIECGHERIGLITAQSDGYAALERQGGALDAFEAAGLPRSNVLIRHGDYRRPSSFGITIDLIEHEHVEALFVCNYSMSQGAMQAIMESGLRIGSNFSYAAYEYFDKNALFYPRFTAVCPPVVETARIATDVLLRRIEEPDYPSGQVITLSNQINWQDSFAPAR